MKMLFNVALGISLLTGTVAAREVPIGDFFRDAEFTTLKISPDGQHMAVIVPREDRSLLVVMNVSDRKILGNWDYGEDRYFDSVAWANNKRILFRVSEKTGAVDHATGKADLYASNIDGTHRIDIPNGNTYSIVDMYRSDPDTVLVARAIESTLLFKLNVNNGRITPMSGSPVDLGSFLVDRDGNVRYTFGEMNDGRKVAFRRVGDNWRMVHEAPRGGDDYFPLGFTADGAHVYVAKSDDGAATSIVEVDPETGNETLVSSNGTVDADDMLWSSDGTTLLGLRYDDGMPYWDFVGDSPETAVYASLAKSFPGKAVEFMNSSEDGNLIAFRVYSDRDPGSIYLYDRKAGTAKFLMAAMDWIKPEEMAPMRGVEIKARDGLVLHGYLTTPAGSEGRKLPLIINPHGGPHGVRDSWGFNPEAQFFANRGYAVLQVNFRGSGGYGGAFERAGYRKWGTAMQDDLTDSVRWAIAEGVADPQRVCIYGGSYGGYSALMSVVREPDLYKCTVGYAGVYNLDIQRSDSDTSDFKAGRSYLSDVFPPTSAERRAQSPINGVERIKAAVMLAHGVKDRRVPIKNMHELIDRMKAVGKAPEEVVVESTAEHGFRSEKGKVALYGKMLEFFERHIGSADPASR